jgi:hypothetical protein
MLSNVRPAEVAWCERQVLVLAVPNENASGRRRAADRCRGSGWSSRANQLRFPGRHISRVAEQHAHALAPLGNADLATFAGSVFGEPGGELRVFGRFPFEFERAGKVLLFDTFDHGDRLRKLTGNFMFAAALFGQGVATRTVRRSRSLRLPPAATPSCGHDPIGEDTIRLTYAPA